MTAVISARRSPNAYGGQTRSFHLRHIRLVTCEALRHTTLVDLGEPLTIGSAFMEDGVLKRAFEILGPQLSERYEHILAEFFSDSPSLKRLHNEYKQYASLDSSLPRPILAYFGYHSLSSIADFNDLDQIGDALLIPQAIRDFLAIHDDIVDEDLEKFSQSTLPVRFSERDGLIDKQGKDLALFYGDLLFSMVLRLAADAPQKTGALVNLIRSTINVTLRGQIEELLIADRPLSDIGIDEVLGFASRKAADYCYAFPYSVGAALSSVPGRVVTATRQFLLDVGTLSQLIDDLTGAFPGEIDHDKDALGEIINLRPTVPLVMLAQTDIPRALESLLRSSPPLSYDDAADIRDYLRTSTVPTQAIALCRHRLARLKPRLHRLPLGEFSTSYLSDLLDFRVRQSLNRLEQSIGTEPGQRLGAT